MNEIVKILLARVLWANYRANKQKVREISGNTALIRQAI